MSILDLIAIEENRHIASHLSVKQHHFT